MANSVFKGFKLVTSATTSFDAGYLYFVRTNADNKDGYLYFNGKKYGTAYDAATELKGIIGTVPSGYTNLVAYIQAIDESLETRISSAETAIETLSEVTSSALTSLDTRIDALEALSGTSHTHDNKTVLDGISAEKVAAWDAAEENAKGYASAYTDNKISGLDAEVSGSSNGVKVKVAEADGKLSGITVEAPDFDNLYDVKGAAASAETASKAYADGIVSAETESRKSADAALLGDATATTTEGATIHDVKRSVAAEKLAREAAISSLTATVSGSSNGVKVTVAESEGKLSGITVEAPDFDNLYDAKGAAASAKTEIIGTASTSANTLGKIEATILANEEVTASALTALNSAISAETSARTEADAALDARIDALEALSGTSHTHDNKTVLDGISAEKVAAWDAAEQNAKNYTDSAITALDAVVTGETSGVTVTVTETNGKLTAATAELHISATSNNAISMNSDGLFAAIYYEDLDS